MRIRNAVAAMTIGCVTSLAAAQDGPIPSPGDRTEESAPLLPYGLDNVGHPLPLTVFEIEFRDGAASREKGAYLGVSTSPPAEAVRQQLKLSVGTGLGVDFVEPGSPASDAGLKQYDVVTKLDDQILIDSHQLAVLVRMHKPGDEVTLTIIREGKTQSLKAKLVEHELPPLEMLGNFNAEFFNQVVPPPPAGFVPGVHKNGRPGPEAGQRFQFRLTPGAGALSTTTWADGEHTLTVTSSPDSKQKKLVATDRNGTVLFNGPIDTPEDRAKIPTIVADKLKKLEAATTLPPAKENAPGGENGGKSGKGEKGAQEGGEEVEIQIKS